MAPRTSRGSDSTSSAVQHWGQQGQPAVVTEANVGADEAARLSWPSLRRLSGCHATHHPSIRPRRLRVSKSMVTARVHSAIQALWKTLTEAERSGVRAREASCTGHGMIVGIPWVVMDGIVVWCGWPPWGQHCGYHSHGWSSRSWYRCRGGAGSGACCAASVTPQCTILYWRVFAIVGGPRQGILGARPVLARR
jgi:hypothetical protein